MALIFLEKSSCPICGSVLKTGQEITGFPPFVSNQADPLMLFHDAGFHKDCVLAHALWPTLDRRITEYHKNTGPGNRACFVCREQIIREDEYFGLGHLTDNPTSPLYRFNYAYFHRLHLVGWKELPALIRQLDELDKSGTWKGDGLKWSIKELIKIGDSEGTAQNLRSV